MSRHAPSRGRITSGSVETFFEARKRAEVARRLGISVHTYDNYVQAAFYSLRHRLTQDADVFTDFDRSLWYDRIEELRARDAAARRRRASGTTGERSTTEGERSTTEGERGKTVGSAAASAASAAKS